MQRLPIGGSFCIFGAFGPERELHDEFAAFGC
jgi:hypothetical protein